MKLNRIILSVLSLFIIGVNISCTRTDIWNVLKEFTVTYNSNTASSGTVPVDSIMYKSGSIVTVLDNTSLLKRTGYTFTGWNTKADGTGSTYTAGQYFTISASDVILYAAWTVNPTFSVTFKENGATSGSVPVINTVYETGQSVAIPGNSGDLVNPGYSFTGWNTASDGSGDTYTQSQNYIMGSADTIFYALWTLAPTYKVTYMPNSADSGDVPVDTTNYVSGQNAAVLENTGNLYRSGYTFAGWNDSSEGSGTDYAPTSVITMDSDKVLYAKWVAEILCTVIYKRDGSSTGAAPVDPTVYSPNAVVTVFGNTGGLVTLQTRDGITLVFNGWNTLADGTGTFYSAGSTFNMGLTNIVLYPHWGVLRAAGPAGGWIFYDKGDYTDGWRYLEAAPYGWYGVEVPSKIWGKYGTAVGVTGTGIGTGKRNSVAIVNILNTPTPVTDCAAQVCDMLVCGSFSDWFLPSKDELNQISTNLYLYNIGGLTGNFYWSSSEESPGNASSRRPDTNEIMSAMKTSSNYIRPARAFRSINPTYVVVYNGNGNTGGNVPLDSYHYEPGQIITILGNTGDLANTGSFIGWNTQADGNGINYTAGQQLPMVSDNIILYAKWNASLYAVKDAGPSGGLIFYDKGTYSDGWRYLEAAPFDQGSYTPWYNGGYVPATGANALFIGSGRCNTDKIIMSQGNTGSYAAKLCTDYKINDYSGWFLPSKDELNEMYVKLKMNNLGGFYGAYWSSSDDDMAGVWVQNFDTNLLSNNGTSGSIPNKVRAVRAF